MLTHPWLLEFSFPFARIGSRIDPLSMTNMGSQNSTDPPVTGTDRSSFARQLLLVGSIGWFSGYNIRRRDMKAIPMAPSIRLVAAT